MELTATDFNPLGLLLIGGIGLSLVCLSLILWIRRPDPSPQGAGLPRELEHLFSEISKGLRVLSTPVRAGNFLMLKDKQEEIGKKLADLQAMMRVSDEQMRKKYEARAERILEEAAKAGITLPLPDSSVFSG